MPARSFSFVDNIAATPPPSDVTRRASELVTLQKLAEKSKDAAIYREVVDGWKDLHGPRHPYALQATSSFAQLLQDGGDFAGAESLAREVEQGTRAVLGDKHPDALIAMSNLAQLLTAAGKTEQAKPLAHEALEGMRETLGNDAGCARRSQYA